MTFEVDIFCLDIQKDGDKVLKDTQTKLSLLLLASISSKLNQRYFQSISQRSNYSFLHQYWRSTKVLIINIGNKLPQYSENLEDYSQQSKTEIEVLSKGFRICRIFTSSIETKFVVTDLVTNMLVGCKGTLLDLFIEGQSVVVEGFICPRSTDVASSSFA